LLLDGLVSGSIGEIEATLLVFEYLYIVGLVHFWSIL